MSAAPAVRPATVLVVEDDRRTRDRLARAVVADERLTLLDTCGSVAEAITRLAGETPDVLLTDLGLPDGSGIDVIRHARTASQQTRAMVITVFGDEETVVGAIEAGATGYLLKDDTPRAIGDAIVELIDGGSPISPPIARLLLRRVAGDTTAAAEGAPAPEHAPVLTPREREVLNLVAKGFSFSEIARLLAVSPHTVTAHVRHIYEKLEVSSRGEAVFEAVQQGLIRLRD